MDESGDRYLDKYWAGLAILDPLSTSGTTLTSEQVRTALGTRSVKGIGSALRPTRLALELAGIRLDEAVSKRSERGRTVWTGGPRLRQARHVLDRVRRDTTEGPRDDSASLAPPAGYTGPVVVLRALKTRGELFEIHGGLDELDSVVDDPFLPIDDGIETIGEVFIDRIEPGSDGEEHAVPSGYGEHGIWVRGVHDYAQPRVSGAIGTGRRPTMAARIAEATWVERRIALVDAARQVESLLAPNRLSLRSPEAAWRQVDESRRFRYVDWMATGALEKRSAPPLRMRLRCWYEIVIVTPRGRRVVLREEGLRGDDERTVARATDRWRTDQAAGANPFVAIREVRIARSQPRPVPPEEALP